MLPQKNLAIKSSRQRMLVGLSQNAERSALLTMALAAKEKRRLKVVLCECPMVVSLEGVESVLLAILMLLGVADSQTSQGYEVRVRYYGCTQNQKRLALKRWFKEDWKDVRTGKACGRKKGKNAELLTAVLPSGFLQRLQKRRPKCRPQKSVSVSTRRSVLDSPQASRRVAAARRRKK